MKTNTLVKLAAIIAVGLIALATTVCAQVSVPTTGGSDGGSSSTSLIPVGNNNNNGATDTSATPFIVTNLAAITDHVELVSEVFKSVNGILVSFSASASAQSYQPSYFFAYTNKVKTLEDIMGMVTNSYVSLPVVSTNAPISISVLFYDSSNESLVRGYVSPPSGQSFPSVLFQGYNGGVLQMNQWGQWTLPDWAEQVQMRLSGNIFVQMTNVVTAHLVYTNSSGQWMSMDLPVNYLQGFTFPPDWAGQGIIVLGTYRFVGNNIYYDQHAYDLGNGAAEVPITYVLVRALLEGSDDFSSFVDSTNMSVQLWTYQDGTGMTFGKVPLIMATFTRATTAFVSVYDQMGNYATSFIVEDEATGVRTTVNVPSGSEGVNVTLPKGVYHILPEGMNLKPYWMYSYYYGGKG
ncbi:MAG: hypothetical protein KGJ35_00065 [Patescibacteria group bacterium]|nr:hypothetical protein [Patescibacteria group bacterium]